MSILVPETLTFMTAKGKLKVANTVTKTGNLASRNKEKSLILVPDSTVTKPKFYDPERIKYME
jgi:hypothetical protein